MTTLETRDGEFKDPGPGFPDRPGQRSRGLADAGLYIARGGPPTYKPAGGHPPALTLAEQALLSVLRQRFRTPQHVLAELFGVVTGTIATAERKVKPLLSQGAHASSEPPAAGAAAGGEQRGAHPG